MAAGIGLAAAFVAQFQQFVFDEVTATFLTGLAVLFAALWAIVKIMRSAILDRVQSLFNEYIFKTGLRAMLLGTVITALVQSSSVTTSLIVPLAGAGLLTNNQVLPYVMGANLGTTITALLAALSLGEVTGLAVALAHLLFNICGISVFYPLRRAPIFLAETLARWAAISPAIPITVILITYLGVPILCIFLVT
jgi:sodium-dependent phosphate cotransporter